MNRTERLHAINESLRREGANGLTAAALAREFEVSTRTIKRDVLALQQIGSPIWSQPGRGGGYVLDGSANLPPVAFTPSQGVAMATALQVLPSGSPFSTDARAASAKLFDTLGTQARQQAARIASKVWVLAEHEGVVVAPRVLRAIEQSLVEERTLSIRYRSKDDVVTERVVEPMIAAWADRHWHLVSYCTLRRAVRWFRFDRIERANITGTAFVPRPLSEIGTPPDRAVPVQ